MKSRSLVRLKNVLTSLFIIGFMFVGVKAFAADNVLQAVEIDGRNDSYNIILRSDDKAEVKKTVQAPNKMVLTLTGIRASKTINTIYNNTANVDSVVVEPTSDESVKIFIQANNVENAVVDFDTLKTPLTGVGSNNNSSQQQTNQIVLNRPVSSYQPVYNEPQTEEQPSGFGSFSASPVVYKAKKALSHNKSTAMMGFGMMLIFLVLCIRTIKNGDSKIKVGLSQSLKAKELENYREEQLNNRTFGAINATTPQGFTSFNRPAQSPNGAYGLKAYQTNNRSQYTSSEITRKPAMSNRNSNLALQQAAKALSQKKAIQQAMSNKTAFTSPVRTAPQRPAKKSSNIDSMKFLESMTKIYEKNGRTDLAQGLKNNMKKAKVNLG